MVTYVKCQQTLGILTLKHSQHELKNGSLLLKGKRHALIFQCMGRVNFLCDHRGKAVCVLFKKDSSKTDRNINHSLGLLNSLFMKM